MFSELNFGNESYKLRLTTKSSIALERALGYNPIELLLAIDAGKMPKLGDMLIILHSMLQALHHGITLDKTYEIFDRYVADGHGMLDLIPIYVEVFQQSGYLAVSAGNEEEVKN